MKYLVTISKISSSVFATYGELRGLVAMWLVGGRVQTLQKEVLTTVSGCLPPLASVTAVRVVNFTTYNWAKDRISDMFQRVTGESPLEEYRKPGSTPTITGLLTFTTAGLAAGLVTSPLACKITLNFS